MTNRYKKREQHKPASPLRVLLCTLQNKSGALRDRRERRPKDARRKAEWRDGA